MKTMAREGDHAEILRRLKSLSPSCTRRWGRMSPHQMVCHLNDSFLAVMGRRPVSMATGPLQRTVIRWLALYAPLRWPPGVQTRPEIDQWIGGTAPMDFVTDVTVLESLCAEFIASIDTAEGLVHPIFGPMSKSDWLRWAYLHMDHHLRQFGC